MRTPAPQVGLEEQKEKKAAVVDGSNRPPGLPNDTEDRFLALLVAACCEPVSDGTLLA
jgi:hypothetical protein